MESLTEGKLYTKGLHILKLKVNNHCLFLQIPKQINPLIYVQNSVFKVCKPGIITTATTIGVH